MFLLPQVTRRRFSGALTAAGGLCALLIGLAVIDVRVREEIARAFTSRGPTEELTTVGAQLHGIALTVAQAVQDQSIEHSPLMIFALVSAVLLLLLART